MRFMLSTFTKTPLKHFVLNLNTTSANGKLQLQYPMLKSDAPDGSEKYPSQMSITAHSDCTHQQAEVTHMHIH